MGEYPNEIHIRKDAVVAPAAEPSERQLMTLSGESFE